MSPRPYNLGKRAEQIDQARRQVLDAARALLGEATSYTDFTVDAVANRADVARGTVYYQFESKAGLLEALCDDLGSQGGLADLAEVFANPDPDQALAGFIGCFARFWQVDRTVMRRLRALAALDPDIQAVISARDARRHEALSEIVGRFATRASITAGHRCQYATRATRQLLALSSFETFDTIASPEQDFHAIVPQVVALAISVLDTRTPSANPDTTQPEDR